MRSFSFLSATSGFVETEAGALLWTGDGGASFEARTSVPLFGAKPGQIRFLSPEVGIAIVGGENIGRILRTVDGGRSWAQVAEVTQSLSSVTFATALVGYADGADETLLRTEDGGVTWKPMPLALPAGAAIGELEEISCAGPEVCLIATSAIHNGAPDLIMRTVDGGRTATSTPAFTPAREIPALGAVAFAGGERAVAVGASGATALSSDGGASFATQVWHESPFEELSQQPRVRLGASPLEAYVGAEHGVVAASSDGGLRWRLMRLPTSRSIVDVAFPRAQTGFAVEHDGAVYRTDDGGSSWRGCGREGRAPGSLLAPSASTVVVSTARGIWRSTDGCARFSHLSETVSLDGRRRPLSSFDLSYGGAARAGAKAMIVFGGAQILESSDDGAHWALLPYPAPGRSLADVSFLSANVGYVLVEGRIYFTRNRGRGWREILSLPSNEHAEPPTMSFSSVSDGFVATRYADEEGGNIVFRTENGGRSWTPEQLPNHIGGVTASRGLAYAVREGGGEVFLTSRGGLSGAPSDLALAISGPATRSPRALARAHGKVTVHGHLSSAEAGAVVQISSLQAGGGWEAESVTTDAHGDFSLTVDEISATTSFVADWNGDDAHRGAGTRPVQLTVRR